MVPTCCSLSDACPIRKTSDSRRLLFAPTRVDTSRSTIRSRPACRESGPWATSTDAAHSHNDFEIVAANLLDGDNRRVSDRLPAYALYVDPPLARIGMTEREVRASGRKALVGEMKMARVGRARERSETQGYMQVLVDAEDQRILGAMLLGTEADEAIHCLLDVMYARAPHTVITRAVHIHPTVSELIPTLLGDLKPLV
jgi:pyruvate/2-oxoglutarate dehydrogenase complex dihydrolipoamide dehydrogenase (E3) component